MAYADAPFGFIPRRYLSGAPYNGAANPYWVDAADATALYIGDPVMVDGTSNTAEVKVLGSGNWPVGTLEGVTRATAGATNKVVGVVVAVLSSPDYDTVYRAASTERVVLVADNPYLVFEAQADGAIPAASVGLNSNIVLDTAGSAATGQSGAEIDATTATGATNQLTILGLVNDPKNEVNAAGNRFYVQFTLHHRASAGGVAGV